MKGLHPYSKGLLEIVMTTASQDLCLMSHPKDDLCFFMLRYSDHQWVPREHHWRYVMISQISADFSWKSTCLNLPQSNYGLTPFNFNKWEIWINKNNYCAFAQFWHCNKSDIIIFKAWNNHAIFVSTCFMSTCHVQNVFGLKISAKNMCCYSTTQYSCPMMPTILRTLKMFLPKLKSLESAWTNKMFSG